MGMGAILEFRADGRGATERKQLEHDHQKRRSGSSITWSPPPTRHLEIQWPIAIENPPQNSNQSRISSIQRMEFRSGLDQCTWRWSGIKKIQRSKVKKLTGIVGRLSWCCLWVWWKGRPFCGPVWLPWQRSYRGYNLLTHLTHWHTALAHTHT